MVMRSRWANTPKEVREQGARPVRPANDNRVGRVANPVYPQSKFPKYARPAFQPPSKAPNPFDRLPPARRVPGFIPLGLLGAGWAAAGFADQFIDGAIMGRNHAWVPSPNFDPAYPGGQWEFRHGPNTYPLNDPWPPLERRMWRYQAWYEACCTGPETGKISGQAMWGLTEPISNPVGPGPNAVSYWIPAVPSYYGSQTHAWFWHGVGANYGPMQPRIDRYTPPYKFTPSNNPNAQRWEPGTPPALPPPPVVPRTPEEWQWSNTPKGEPLPRTHRTRPPEAGVKEPPKAQSKAAKIGVFMWKMMDTFSELTEIGGALYDALPLEVRQKWNCAEGTNIGQYGSDLNACRAAALWHNVHKLNTPEAFMNIAKNVAEDMTIGQFHKWLSKVTPPGFSWEKTALTHASSYLGPEAYIAGRLKELFRFLGLEEAS